MPGKSFFTAESTWWALAVAGRVVASTELNLMFRNGSPKTTSRAPLAIAITNGRRITIDERLDQKPRLVASIRCHRFGARALTRVPRRRSTAGMTISDVLDAMTTTRTPPTPIE